jgi:hypothetical protein
MFSSIFLQYTLLEAIDTKVRFENQRFLNMVFVLFLGKKITSLEA